MHQTDDIAEADKRKGARRAAGQDPVKRAQILAGAKRCFMSMGFEATSMNEITAEAGVSKGTIYVYFEDKQALFRALIESEKSATLEALRVELRAAKTIDDALRRFGVLLTTRLTCDDVVKAQRMVLGVIDRIPEAAQIFYGNETMSGPTVLRDFLDDKVAAGEIAIADTNLAARQFVDLSMASLYKRRLFGNMPKPPTKAEISKVVDAAVAMFLTYYHPKA